MSKIVIAAFVATVLAAGAVQIGTAGAAPNNRDSSQTQSSGKKSNKDRKFWEQMQRNGS